MASIGWVMIAGVMWWWEDWWLWEQGGSVPMGTGRSVAMGGLGGSVAMGIGEVWEGLLLWELGRSGRVCCNRNWEGNGSSAFIRLMIS